MIRALYTAATGLRAQETNIDVISNNLANVNTTSFKKSNAHFQDLMYQYLQDPGAQTSATTQTPTGISVGLGVKSSSTQRVFTQGDLLNTNNPLDLAIQGDGFFQVTLPDGTIAYTRAGSFRLDKDGKMVTEDGYPISPEITIPSNATEISVAESGEFTITTPSGTETAGPLTPARFANNSGLRAIGRNLYLESESSGTPTTGTFSEDGFGRLTQRHLESSNVSVVEQVVNMITGQRAYEASSKAITSSDEMLGQAINLKR